MSPENLKAAAVDYLQLVARGEIETAFEKYVGPEFWHHNPYFAGDGDSLREGMEASQREMPHKRLEVQHVLADGEMVAVHSRLQTAPEQPGVAVVHLLRFEGERIAELWDIGQAEPEDSPNQYGMF